MGRSAGLLMVAVIVFATPSLAQTWISRAALQQAPSSADPILLGAVFDQPSVGPAVPVSPRLTANGDAPLTRDWPDALRFKAGGYGFEVTPHAGLGLSPGGRSAEAGAILSFGPGGDGRGERLKDLGVRDGKAFGDQGRWYLFAAVKGKAVGLNMTRTGDGEWRRAGLSSDAASAVIGDGQLGVGWRQGGMQAAFGYVHREIKVRNAPRGADGGIDDSMAAFTLSFKPRR